MADNTREGEATAAQVRTPLGIKIEHGLSRWLGGQSVFILMLSVLLGVAGGYGAILFRKLISLVNWAAFPGGIDLAQLAASPWYEVVAPVAAGGLVVGPMVHFLAPEARGHGVPEVMDACANKGGRIRPRVAAIKILASAINIGSGGSVGREGPIVQIGSSLGSSAGQFFGLSGDRLKTLVGCGAAAGIAATFNAPIAGALFAIEIILGRASARTFSPLVVGSVLATVICRLHLGNSPAFTVAPHDLVSPLELPWYVALGALAAVVGVGFTRGLYLLEDLWLMIPLPEYSKGVLGGALVGLMGLWFPQVLGVGYEHIDQVLQWNSPTIPLGTLMGAALLLLLIVVKIAATGTTIGSGGSGGIFAPSLMLGACLGGAYGNLVGALMPAGTVAAPPAYAMVAMGAVVAATTHAPLTAMIIVFELTDRHTIILPLMLSCILSTIMAMRLGRESIYTLKLVRRGAWVGPGSEAQMLRTTRVRELTREVAEPLHPETPLGRIVEQVVEGRHTMLYVTDAQAHVVGEVSVDDVASIIRHEEELKHLLVAADVMRPPSGLVQLDNTLADCMELFSRRQAEELAVVDPQGHLLGQISRADVIALYHREVLRQDTLFKFVEEHGSRSARTERLFLPKGHVKREIPANGKLVGRSLRELDLRARLGVIVYAVRDRDGQSMVPDPDRPLAADQTLVVFGPEREVDRLQAPEGGGEDDADDRGDD
jgi:CIC family chloride channel protein